MSDEHSDSSALRAGVISRLRAAGLRPNRALGQNFLHDPRLLDELVAIACVGPDDAVFEVGTGPGTLTRHLAEKARFVLSVEIDPALAAFARAELSSYSNVEIVVADALAGKSRLDADVERRLRALGPFLWVSNLPYQITTPLVLTLLEAGLDWRRAALTVQLEAAERLSAGPGSKAYGAASLLVQFWARPRVERRIRAGTFWPRPQVESAVLVLEPREPPIDRASYPRFRQWVRTLFGARRKQVGALLRAAVGAGEAGTIIERLGWDPTRRPETLDLDEVLELARNFDVSTIDGGPDHL